MNLEFFSVKDLASVSGESEAVWRKRILHREIPFTKFGRNVRVSRESFKQFVSMRTILVPGASAWLEGRPAVRQNQADFQ